MKQKLINQYDTKDTLLMVSLYPKQGELYSTNTSGIASYAKNIVKHLSRPVVVLTGNTGGKRTYEENNALVVRCFNKQSIFMWFVLLQKLFSFSKARQVLIQFDLALYNETAFIFLIPFVVLLRLCGYTVFINLHSVVRNVFRLSGHLGLGTGVFDIVKGISLNIVLGVFYFCVGAFSNGIIVAEEALKEKLAVYVSENKIEAIPHGVDEFLRPISKNVARKKLGLSKKETIVLFFGFVNWFKGTDIFVQTFQETTKLLHSPARFLIAGGKSATLMDEPYYKKYFGEVEKVVHNSKKIELTGFIPQEKMKLYFSAADIVVLPYRHFMAASGVLSLIFSFQKPFLLSHKLKDLLKAPDIRAALKETSLRNEEVFFHLEPSSLLNATEAVLVNGRKQKMKKLAGIIREKRSWKNTAPLFDELLFKQPVYVLPPHAAVSFIPKTR